MARPQSCSVIATTLRVETPFRYISAIEDWQGNEFMQRIADHGDILAQQHWDSGGPGAGAGYVTAYNYFGSFVTLEDDGPHVHPTREAAIHDVTTITDAAVSVEVYDRGRRTILSSVRDGPYLPRQGVLRPTPPLCRHYTICFCRSDRNLTRDDRRKLLEQLKIDWSARPGSNRRPSAWECDGDRVTALVFVL